MCASQHLLSQDLLRLMAMAKRTARNSASGEDDDYSEDNAMMARVPKWKAWRLEFPVRANEGKGISDQNKLPKTRPKKSEQREWQVYTEQEQKTRKDKTFTTTRQQWMMTPFLVPSDASQTLSGAPATADLFTCSWRDQEVMHYTNIHRVQHLAEKHPLVAMVGQHKMEKALDPAEFNNIGRCKKFHQSPWDLKVTLAASGAEMVVGVSVNGAASELLSTWWRPIGQFDEKALHFMEAIFFDIVEGDHLEPQEVPEHLWQTTGARPFGHGVFLSMICLHYIGSA